MNIKTEPWILKLLVVILPMISNQFKEILPGIIKSLEDKAKTTSNPIDDVFVMILKGLLGV